MRYVDSSVAQGKMTSWFRFCCEVNRVKAQSESMEMRKRERMNMHSVKGFELGGAIPPPTDVVSKKKES